VLADETVVEFAAAGVFAAGVEADVGLVCPPGDVAAVALLSAVLLVWLLWNLDVTALTAHPAQVEATSVILGLALTLTSASK
jgi:hypothetical protein